MRKKPVSKINCGSPWPLGSSITRLGVNFSVAAPHATKLELLIFHNPKDDSTYEIITLVDSKNKSGDYWHVEVEGINQGCRYCYRVISNVRGAKRNQLLLDPCSRAISGWNSYKRQTLESQKTLFDKHLKSVVTERDRFDFDSHPRPRHPWEQTIIYELHVGGFTQSKNSSVCREHKGTFLGLIEKIPYIRSLGVTTIELLPVFAFDIYDSPRGVQNYWGYSPLNWFTPHSQYVSSNDPLKARDEFRTLVAACHDAQLEVILDVVYNHTTEGNESGPTISWKGFGESTYYHQDKKNKFLDVTGCGNTIAANKPLVRNQILESLRCWAIELGVDGFRFDLGIALSRGEDLLPLEEPPLFEEIESDPLLSDLKLISEPWDCGGLYKLDDFPAKRFSTWNGHFRDDVRKFWKGDKNCTWVFKDKIMGSPDLYKSNGRYTKYSVNFITSHDGFTLRDLLSFNTKHNLANGENNRDGDNSNNSFNHGVEGPSSDKKIEILRKKQQRNLLSTLLFSPGVPMILMGDEVGRSQGGNNNTWCQNNNLGWMIWGREECDYELKLYLEKLINIRKSLPEFFSPKKFLPDNKKSLSGNNLWVEWHGIKLKEPDFCSWSHTISYSINYKDKGSCAWFGFNAYEKAMNFELPRPISQWVKVLDTSKENQEQDPKTSVTNQKNIEVAHKSMVLMIEDQYAKRINY